MELFHMTLCRSSWWSENNPLGIELHNERMLRHLRVIRYHIASLLENRIYYCFVGDCGYDFHQGRKDVVVTSIQSRMNVIMCWTNLKHFALCTVCKLHGNFSEIKLVLRCQSRKGRNWRFLVVTSNLVTVHIFQDEKAKKKGLILAQREISE